MNRSKWLLVGAIVLASAGATVTLFPSHVSAEPRAHCWENSYCIYDTCVFAAVTTWCGGDPQNPGLCRTYADQQTCPDT